MPIVRSGTTTPEAPSAGSSVSTVQPAASRLLPPPYNTVDVLYAGFATPRAGLVWDTSAWDQAYWDGIAGIAASPTVGTPLAGVTAVLTATGITASPVVGTPAIGQAHVLTATGITASPTAGTPAIGQAHVLTATGITASPTMGAPAVGQLHAIVATGITSSPVVGSPAVGQAHVLAATGITASPVVGSPAVGQNHALTATGITASPSVASPAIGQVHVLAATGITSSPVVGNPLLAESGTITPVGITSSPTVGTPALTVIGSASTGTGFGVGGGSSPLQHVGDTRFDGVRRAREEARAAFDEVAATTPARRKEAAVRAADAVAIIARRVARPAMRPAASTPDLLPVLDQLEALQAQLAGLIDQDRAIRAAQARQVAEMWAIAEREMTRQQAEEEELMLVLALAA